MSLFTCTLPFALCRHNGGQGRNRTAAAGLFSGGTGVPPVNHAQDARTTVKLHHHLRY